MMLNIRGRDWRSDSLPEAYATLVATRTRIVLASDYSVYHLDQYRQAMDALRDFKVSLCLILFDGRLY